MKAHICWANRTASRVLVRGKSTAVAAGPATVAAIVAVGGIDNRLRSSGTAIETESGTTLRVEGDLMVADALLLERITNELVAAGTEVSVDLADLDFMDSESAAVLKRISDDPLVQLLGLEIFLQSAIDLAERNSHGPN